MNYLKRFEQHTEGLAFLSVGGCPGCKECGLETKWRITGIPSGITLPKPFDTEEEALEELDDMRADPVVIEAAKRWNNDLGKMTVEEVPPTDDEIDTANEGSFSWSACDTCGSSLGGNRYSAHASIGDANGELIHLDVCEDCLQYIANGTLPEEEEVTK